MTEEKRTRRGFLKMFGGAAAGTVAAVAVPVAPHIEEEVIKVKKYEHELVKVPHFITKGDGKHEGDIAMIQLDEGYRTHVLTDGKWRRMFAS